MKPWEQNPQWWERTRGRKDGLYFDFSRALRASKFDGTLHGLTHIMDGCVDFVVEWEHQLWLVEVKDPDRTLQSYHSDAVGKFFEKISSGALIETELFPKLRDTLIYLGLDQGIPTKALRYMVLIGLEELDVAQMDGLKTSFWQYKWVAGPKRGWGKSFDVLVFNVDSWNRNLPHCPITRISEN